MVNRNSDFVIDVLCMYARKKKVETICHRPHNLRKEFLNE